MLRLPQRKESHWHKDLADTRDTASLYEEFSSNLCVCWLPCLPVVNDSATLSCQEDIDHKPVNKYSLWLDITH